MKENTQSQTNIKTQNEKEVETDIKECVLIVNRIPCGEAHQIKIKLTETIK